MIKQHSLGILLGLSSAIMLSACGSSSDTASTADTEDYGELQLAITDAEEDFLSYKIEIDSITLIRNDGTEVSVLPMSTEVDFVQYQELSELFAVRSVPPGIYDSISLSLDYSEAEIIVQNEAGEQFVASAVDTEGNAITELELSLQLNDDDPVRIRPRQAAHLTLDLDLAASNTIESFEPEAIVVVEPFMIGTAEHDENREHRVRGLLASTDLETETVTLNIRPMRLKQGEFGTFTFSVSSETVFEINGAEFSGEAGLSALAALNLDTPVIAFGQTDSEAGAYMATQVNAGSSVPWADTDIIKGIVTARSDNTITLQGAVLELAGNEEESALAAHFKQEITLNVSDDTTVTGYRLGDASIDQVSIGQKLIASGSFDSSTDVFTATDGHIRMQLNKVVGEVVTPSPLVIDLSHINKRPVDIFNFSGTGISTEDDSQADNYEIDTAALDTSAIQSSEWVQVRGYPTAFGQAPMDFDALSILNPDTSSHDAKLHARWSSEQSGNVVIENDVLALNAEGLRDKLHLVGIPASSKLDLEVQTVAGVQSEGKFSILARGEGLSMFRSYNDFIVQLQSLLANGMDVIHLTASGSYSDSNKELTASYLTVKLINSEASIDVDIEAEVDVEAEIEAE